MMPARYNLKHRRMWTLAGRIAAISLCLWLVLAPASPATCESGKCEPITCHVDLDCEKGCVCNQNLDEGEAGVCIPPV